MAELAGRAGLPMPRVFMMDEAQPNAFATGRNPQNAAVAVTTGLMQQLSREELAGVIAHELAHIKNHDTLLMTITATIAGAISMLAQFGMFFGGNRDNNNGPGIIGSIAMMILAPLGAMLVQMAISRTREYAADDLGARICGQPMWLASALAKIANAAHQVPNYGSRAQSGDRAHVHHQPAVGPRHGQSVRDPSRRPRTASPRCSSSRRKWARRADRLPSAPAATIRAAARGAGRRPRAGRGAELVIRGAPLGPPRNSIPHARVALDGFRVLSMSRAPAMMAAQSFEGTYRTPWKLARRANHF